MRIRNSEGGANKKKQRVSQVSQPCQSHRKKNFPYTWNKKEKKTCTKNMIMVIVKRGRRREGWVVEKKRIVRQSLRLSGKDPDGKTAKLDEKVKLQQKIEEDRLLKYEKLVKLHKSKGNAKLPKTASYAHTLDRVLSMSTKALESRMNKIERANGKYAIVKMRMFAEVLLLEKAMKI